MLIIVTSSLFFCSSSKAEEDWEKRESHWKQLKSLQNELDIDLGEIEEYISFSEVEDKDEDEHEDNQQISHIKSIEIDSNLEKTEAYPIEDRQNCEEIYPSDGASSFEVNSLNSSYRDEVTNTAKDIQMNDCVTKIQSVWKMYSTRARLLASPYSEKNMAVLSKSSEVNSEMDVQEFITCNDNFGREKPKPVHIKNPSDFNLDIIQFLQGDNLNVELKI